jgi:hypothetical protein
LKIALQKLASSMNNLMNSANLFRTQFLMQKCHTAKSTLSAAKSNLFWRRKKFTATSSEGRQDG